MKYMILVQDQQIEQDIRALRSVTELPRHLQLPSGGYVLRKKGEEDSLVIQFEGDKDILRQGYKITSPLTRCCDVSSTRMESSSYVLDVIPEGSMLLCSWARTRDLDGRVSERLSPSLYIVPLN